MIDLSNEQTLSLQQACRMLPRGRRGAIPHLSTVLRWILNGIKGPQGTRIKLEAVRLGSRWVTSVEALQRFADRLTPSGDDDRSLPVSRSTGARQRASNRAARELEKHRV